MRINTTYFLFILFILFHSNIAQAQKKANIIVFMVDDMGWQDTSYPFDTVKSAFNSRYHTPNMERLAKEGVAFTNAYSTPVCTPSRVSLITGMNASRHHVTNWTSPMKDQPTGRDDQQFEEPVWNHNGMSPVEGIPHTVFAKALPQLLKDNGYFTIHAGKAHWASAGTPGSNPYSLGFVVNIAGTSTGRPAHYWGEQNFGRNTNDYHGIENLQEYFKQDINLTEALTREALKTLDFPINNKIPFFLNLGHYALHDPLMEDKRFYQKYLDQGLPANEAKYASMIESMDKSLGDIMDYLEKKKIKDQTYILFISDNGGLSHTPPRVGTPHTHNKPLRSGKGSIYEGGIRVPFIMKGVKGDLMSKRDHTPVIIEDLFPTILAMAKITAKEITQYVDGQNQLGHLKSNKIDKSAMDRPLIFHIPNKWTTNDVDGFNYRSGIRLGKYKLIWNMRDGSYEFYDLSQDLGEQNNLIQDEKLLTIISVMKTELHNTLEERNAPIPKRK